MRLLPILLGLAWSQEDVQVSCDPDVMEIRITKGKITLFSLETYIMVSLNINTALSLRSY